MITQLPDTQPQCPSSSAGNSKEAQAGNSPRAVPSSFLPETNEPKSARGTRHVEASITSLLAQKVLGRPAEVGGE